MQKRKKKKEIDNKNIKNAEKLFAKLKIYVI